MFNVLFIDDDDFMLRALLRLAKRLRPDWQFFSQSDVMHWRDSTQTDVKLDLIVCDYLMPQLNGDKVLAEAAAVHPGAIRVLLTGDTSEEVVCNASKVAHFVLSKPFNEMDILQVFQSVELTHSLPVSAEVRQMLSSSALLLPLPEVVKQVNKILQNEDAESSDIAEVIEHEPIIVARILQLANSAFMGFSRPTLSLCEAIRRLGVKLTSVVIASISIEQASTTMLDQVTHKKINDEAFTLAMNTRPICKALGCKQNVQEELFMAALLSAVGALITATNKWQQEYTIAYSSWPRAKLEAVVSAFMLTLWGYTDPLRYAVLWSAEPDLYYSDSNHALLLFLARHRKENGGKLPADVLVKLPDPVLQQQLADC